MAMFRVGGRHRVLALAAAFGSLAASAVGQIPLSLEDALRQARAANARLPLPAFDVAVARERRREALADRWLKVAVEGDFLYAPADGWGYDPALTNLGDARLQIVARQPLFQGGALKAGVARADAAVAAAAARYRIAEKDLELDVRSRFAELAAAGQEAAIRREGLERLSSYRTSLASRQASGQGVAADLMKTDVRLALEESAVVDAEQREDTSRLALSLLMGRDPAFHFTLEPLRPLEIGVPAANAAWEAAPEITAAEAEARVAEADLALARAERLPHLSLNADFGFWVSDTTHLKSDFWERFGHDRGYSFALVFAWPIWDRGSLQARLAQADLGLQQARARLEAQRRDALLSFAQARAALSHLARQIEILSRASPVARDSYLQMESRYRGGAASALEVLDAQAAAVDAAVRLNDMTARYRIAQAVAARWSAP